MRSKADIWTLLEEKGAGALAGLDEGESRAALEICGEKGCLHLLAEIASGPDKAAAKQARRILHNLRSRGMDVPEARPSGKSVLHPVDDGFGTVCLVSAFDQGGSRAAFLFRKNPAGGVNATVFYVNEKRGIDGASSKVLGRKEAREYINDLMKGGEVPIARVDEMLFKGFLHKAREMTAEAGRVVPAEAAEVPSEWFEAPPEEAAVRGSADRPSADLTGLLYDEPELAHWVPDRDFIAQMELRVREIETSQILIDEAAKMEHVERYLSDAAMEYFNDETRGRYASRLEWTARIFDVSGRTSAAASARSAAAWLADPSLPIGGCGFAREFIQRLFVLKQTPSIEGGAAADGPGASEQPDRGHLIIAPGEISGVKSTGKVR